MLTDPVAPLMSRATTPPVSTALAEAPLQVTPVAAPYSGAAGTAEREVGMSAPPNLSIAVNTSAEITPTNVAATRHPEALPKDRAVFRDGRKREDSQQEVLSSNCGGGSNDSVDTFYPNSSAPTGPDNINGAAAAIEPATAEDAEEVAAVRAQLAAHFGLSADGGKQQQPLRDANASLGGGMSPPTAQVTMSRCEGEEPGGKDTGSEAVTPQCATSGVQGAGVCGEVCLMFSFFGEVSGVEWSMMLAVGESESTHCYVESSRQTIPVLRSLTGHVSVALPPDLAKALPF